MLLRIAREGKEESLGFWGCFTSPAHGFCQMSGAACAKKELSAVWFWVGRWWVRKKCGCASSNGLADLDFSTPTNKQIESQALRQCCYNRKSQQLQQLLFLSLAPSPETKQAGFFWAHCGGPLLVMADMLSWQYIDPLVTADILFGHYTDPLVIAAILSGW